MSVLKLNLQSAARGVINRPPVQEKRRSIITNTLESILKELISARVEQLARQAEQHPECVKSKEQMLPLRTKAEQIMGKDDAEELVSMVRGYDTPIYEHYYLAGLIDGMHLKETLERMKKP